MNKKQIEYIRKHNAKIEAENIIDEYIEMQIDMMIEAKHNGD